MDSRTFPLSKTPSSILHQTPFERSLGRRLEKVRVILELIEKEDKYTSVTDLSSAAVLRSLIDSFESLDFQLCAAISEYVDASLRRKNLFKGDQNSIKNIAYAIKNAVIRNKSLTSVHKRDVKEIYANIFAQNPLSPPFDLARPNFERDLDAFNLSYQILLDNFRRLIEIGFTLRLLPSGFWCSHAMVEELIENAKKLGHKVNLLIQKVFVIYEERMLAFEKIKEACGAICNRSRFVLGSHHPVYKKVFSLKQAII